ncbi:hypothetical protein B7463_g9987, partial [Scytalidium lignicola]
MEVRESNVVEKRESGTSFGDGTSFGTNRPWVTIIITLYRICFFVETLTPSIRDTHNSPISVCELPDGKHLIKRTTFYFTSKVGIVKDGANPPGAALLLTRSQIWAGLLLKICSGETFVPNVIASATVVSEVKDDSDNLLTTRDVTFIESQRKVRAVVTANIVSEGADGELYMTYFFEWRHPSTSPEALAILRIKEKKMAQIAVQDTIRVMRDLAKIGNI